MDARKESRFSNVIIIMKRNAYQKSLNWKTSRRHNLLILKGVRQK